MDNSGKVKISVLPSGVPDLDRVLGGGIPEYSFNVIAGAPGSGKTTLAHQIVFANASLKCPALYFTVLGEPALKMLRYQQNYSFFDPAKVESAIRFINLSDEVLTGDLGIVLERIVRRGGGSQSEPGRRGLLSDGAARDRPPARRQRPSCRASSSGWPCT